MNMLANVRIADPAERRQGSRLAIGSDSTLRADSHEAIDVIVSDLSETGCAINMALAPAIGTEISIGLVGFGTFDAKVVRKNGDLLGCEFLQPIESHIVSNAFVSTTVVFPGGRAAPSAYPEPFVAKAPIGHRVIFLTGASALLWALVAMAVLAF